MSELTGMIERKIVSMSMNMIQMQKDLDDLKSLLNILKDKGTETNVKECQVCEGPMKRVPNMACGCIVHLKCIKDGTCPNCKEPLSADIIRQMNQNSKNLSNARNIKKLNSQVPKNQSKPQKNKEEDSARKMFFSSPSYKEGTKLNSVKL